MPPREFLYRQNEFVIILTAFVLFLAATELGFRWGNRHKGLPQESKSLVVTVQSAMMVLLALLLAFSFAMAEGRFDTRQRLVVDEANAIGTADLRSQMLPEPYRRAVRQALRDYVDSRLAYHQAGIDSAKLQAATARTEQLQEDLWSQAMAAAGHSTAPVLIALFISSLNDVIDLSAKRDAARNNHVPEVVYYFLFVVAGLSMSLLGYGAGLGNHRHFYLMALVAFLVACAILVVMDFDRPRRGIIEVNQQSMIDLRNNLRAHPQKPKL
jgi:hypothetical protein